MVWLRHTQVQERYSCSRVTIDRVVDEQGLPPKSFPLAGRAPMWASELLDVWDGASPAERELILQWWPDWRGALAAIERERAAAAVSSEQKPKRKRKQKA